MKVQSSNWQILEPKPRPYLPVLPRLFLITLVLTGLARTEVLALSCVDMVQQLGSPLPLTVQAQITILNWLECEECTAESLEAVKALGPGVVPYLACALYNGPSKARLSSSYNFLDQQYSSQSTALALSAQAFLETHLQHLIVQYQIRAAIALGAINTASAKQALQQSLNPAFGLELSEPVIFTVQRALGTTPPHP